MICPAFDGAVRARHLEDGARPVRDGFVYSSDANPETLDAKGLMELLGRTWESRARSDLEASARGTPEIEGPKASPASARAGR
jgi:hypothetical protein